MSAPSGSRRGKRLAVAVGMHLFLVAWFATTGPLHSQQLGDTAAGKRLATEWCSACHLVGPEVRRGATDLAPPFVELANDASTTEFRLRAFLMTPHKRMPDFNLSREQSDDLIAYILSLRRP